MQSHHVLLALGAIALYFLYQRVFVKKETRALPPGPKPTPLVGNIKDLPIHGELESLHWLRHKDKYGPVSSITILGQTLVIIHDKKAAIELLEKRSLQTSGRPVMEFAFNLCGLSGFLSSQQNNATLRKYRKFVHQEFGTKSATASFNKIQLLESSKLLLQLLEKPGNLDSNLRSFAGSVILKITYGYSADTQAPDPLISLIERVALNISKALVAGAWFVDVIPVLRYVPSWCPGAGFKKTAAKWKQMLHAVVDLPYSFTLEQMGSGNATPSYVSKLVQSLQKGNDLRLGDGDEHAIKWTAANLYAAGADTTISTMRCFILAMIMFPDVQRKAQEEIDKVTGGSRLPEFDDRDSLPYVNNLIQEALRWCPVAPMGVPHRADEDISYNGYLIPKGSYLLPAAWWLCHDPAAYHDPETFDPARYSEPYNEPYPDFVFGFGRRKCPGLHLAEASLFIAIARMLSAFNITKALDANGQEVPVELRVKPGIVASPEDFQYRLLARSAEIARVITEQDLGPGEADTHASLLREPVSQFI